MTTWPHEISGTFQADLSYARFDDLFQVLDNTTCTICRKRSWWKRLFSLPWAPWRNTEEIVGCCTFNEDTGEGWAVVVHPPYTIRRTRQEWG